MRETAHLQQIKQMLA